MPEVRVEEVRRFMEESLKAVGAPEEAAKAQTDLLLHADTVGHFSHGLNRLAFYINDIKHEATNPKAVPKIIKETEATAWVDGGDALGATVANFCMKIAIKKAKDSGAAVVCAKNCNHFGMAGYWALQAAKVGCVGMAFTNSSPNLVPTRAKEPVLGTNPIALFAPGLEDEYIGIDMATTAVAFGKVEVQMFKEEPLKEGWALDVNGQPTTDPKEAMKSGRLMPLGGEETNGGYKGYALSALVEVLCSGLAGSKPSHDVRLWSPDGTAGPPNLGQCFIVINPFYFAPGFESRVSGCMKHWNNLEPVDPSLPVLAPGDKERKQAEETTKKGTINYAPNVIEHYLKLAKEIGVEPMKVE
ncbi:hypothetical protein ACJJTC_006485 [Scirpophaga incertulas]